MALHLLDYVLLGVSKPMSIVKAFVLSGGLVYDLLLSKRWMYRVRAVEDHGMGSFSIEGKDGVRRLVRGTTAEPELAEIVNGPSIDEWETNLAEEELARLSEELDSTQA